MRPMLLFVALLAAPRALGACVEPIEPAAFREAVDAAERAAEADAVGRQDAIVHELETGLGCLTFEVDPTLLSRFLLEAALVHHRHDGPWQSWLATSVRTDPRVERNLGAGHPLARWMPEAAPRDPPTYEVLGDQRVVVDGTVRTRYFELPLDGVHLVQIWRERRLESRFLDAGTGLPAVDDARVPAFRYVAPHQMKERQAKARLAAGALGGGFAALGASSLVGGALVHASIFGGSADDRERKVITRNFLYAAGGAGFLLAGASFGVGWAVRW